MKTSQEYMKDLSEIRSMMEQSSKFLSLSGLSGILAGIYALLGAALAYSLSHPLLQGSHSLYRQQFSGRLMELLLIAAVVLILTLGTAVFLSSRKARKKKETLWNPVTRRLVINMAIPLFAGGILIGILISRGLVDIAFPLSLIFYGLALVNASKITFPEIQYLGITEIILGLICSYFIGFGLLFWALGFGAMHIAYGIYMHLKYEK